LVSVISNIPEWNLRIHYDVFYYSDNSTTVESSKLEDDAPDEEEDGQRRRKRPRRVQAKESLDQGGIFQVHPLKVIIHVYEDQDSDSKPTKLITLRFEYLVKLNVVCVGIEGCNEGPENDILCNLFPNDTGLELPQQVVVPLHSYCIIFFSFPQSIIYSLTYYLYAIYFYLNGGAVCQTLCSRCYNIQYSKNFTSLQMGSAPGGD